MTLVPYALGVFRRPAAPVQGGDGDGGEFTGLVVHWDCAQARLDELATSENSGNWTDLAQLDVRCPVSPGQILQCGANYRRHVVDLVMAERRADESMTGHNSQVPEAEVRAWAESMMDERARSGAPYVFAGLPSALKAIGTDWFAAKNAPTFLPTGPYLVPAKFVADPGDLRITLRHNGVVRQDESTADMLFDLPAILAYITGITELRPGDLVLTGSPAGNGMHWGVFLAEGDLLEGEITGLGTQRNHCIRKHERPGPTETAIPGKPPPV
jgi:2-keto-4-pentenoate hydratase/2-oxohepta-3-ene-1,7-dioic acid hydratase in catechol pathway